MRGEVDARSAAGEGAYPQKQATSSRFYDPGASPLPLFFPGTNPGERSAAGRFRLYVIRTVSRQAANPSARAACDLVPSADNTRAHARRRSTTQTALSRLRCFCGVFCPRTVSDKPAMRRISPCARSGHGGQLWRAPRSGNRTVDRGLPDVVASHAQAPHPAPPTERL